MIHLALAGFLAWHQSPTQDEVAHLPAGLCVWRFGRTDLYLVNPPLVRAWAAIPLLFVDHAENWTHDVPHSPRRCEWDVGADFVAANGERSLWLYTLARWMCLPISVVGLWVCWRWGSELCGEYGGLLAAALWCFSPNLLSHGALITSDVAATAFGLLAAWRYSHWLDQSNWKNALLAGPALGLALLAKTYWIILPPLWLLLGSVELWRTRVPRRRRAMALQLIIVLALGLHLLNMGYGYQGTGRRLDQYDFFSKLLSGSARSLEFDAPGNRFRGHWVGEVPVPFPRDYVRGIDIQQQDLDREHWSYLLGEYRQSGWWYYYLVGLAVKVPLGTWCLVLLGIVASQRHPDSSSRWRSLCPLWTSTLILFVLVSAETGMNRHVRYVFPVLPLLYLTAAQAVSLNQKWLVALPLAGVITASLVVYPHSLSFFNFLCGGPTNGSAVLLDSNIDWGQDLIAARNWIRAHPEYRPVTLACLHNFSPEALGIDVPDTPPGRLTAGWHLISVHLLNDPHGTFAVYRNRVPVDRIGFSFNIYHVPDPVD